MVQFERQDSEDHWLFLSTASFSQLLFIQTTWQGVKFDGNNFRLLHLQWRRGSKTGSAAMPLSVSTQHILIPVSYCNAAKRRGCGTLSVCQRVGSKQREGGGGGEKMTRVTAAAEVRRAARSASKHTCNIQPTD